VLGCASSCWVATDTLGKLLKLQARFPEYRTHNAGVEGSSPSLSTTSFRHLRSASRSRDSQTLSAAEIRLLVSAAEQRE
jgi:hypothetical protein